MANYASSVNVFTTASNAKQTGWTDFVLSPHFHIRGI